MSYWLDSDQKSKHTCDFIIIGAGIAGLSTAYWLLEEDPSLSLVILEKNYLGSGASGRNAGFLTCGSVDHFGQLVQKNGEEGADSIWKFSEKNHQLLKEFIIEEAYDEISYQKRGSCSLAFSGEELQRLEQTACLMKQKGIDVESIEANDIEERWGVKKFIGAYHYKHDATLHPLRLLHAIKKKVIEKTQSGQGSFKIFEGQEVFRFEESKNKNTLYPVQVTTNKATFFGQKLIFATNAFSSLLDPYFEKKILPVRGQVLLTESFPQFMEGPCYSNAFLNYFRQLNTGEILIGGCRLLEKETEVGFGDQTTPVIQKALEDFLRTHIPHLQEAKINYRWSGTMGFSVDGNPLVGSLPHFPLAFFLGGFTSHGFGLSFHTAKVLVDYIFGKSLPPFLDAKRLEVL